MFDINYHIITAIQKLIADIPKRPLFKQFIIDNNLTIDDLSEGSIELICREYISTPNTILEDRKYQQEVLKLFIEYYTDYSTRFELQGYKENIFHTKDKKHEFKKHYLIDEIAHLIGSKLENSRIHTTIQNQASVNTSTQTANLQSLNQQKRILLVRNPNTNTTHLITEAQIKEAIHNKQAAAQMAQQISPQPEVFNRITTTTEEVSPDPAAITVLSAPQTTDLLTDLQTQLLLKQAQDQANFLLESGFNLNKQLVVNLQTKKVFAHLIDREGQAILAQFSAPTSNTSFTFTFLTGPNKNKIMILKSKDLTEFAQKKMTADQMLQELKRRMKALEEAEDQQVFDNTEDFLKVSNAVQAAQAYEASTPNQGIADAANFLDSLPEPPEGINFNLKNPAPKPVPRTAQYAQEQRIQQIRQQLKTGKPTTGALQAKKALAAKKLNLTRTEEYRRQNQAQRQKAAADQAQQQKQKPTQQNAPQAETSSNKQGFNWAKWLGIGTSSGLAGTAATFNFLDILDLI